MRIFLSIITLILIVACGALNVLGYNGTLSQIEFILISAAAELLLCLLLGHFMYRTYVNHKRSKSLNQELSNAQSTVQLKTREASEARAAAEQAQAQATQAQAEADALRMQAPYEAPLTEQAADLGSTQPVPTVDNISSDPDATTLYKSPLV